MSSSAELVELDLHRQETEKEAQTDIQLKTSGQETQDVHEELQREDLRTIFTPVGRGFRHLKVK